MKLLITSALVLASLVSGCSALHATTQESTAQESRSQEAKSASSNTDIKKPKNIIYLIGDGMSMAHISAYRYFKNSSASHLGLGNQPIPTTLFDDHFVG